MSFISSQPFYKVFSTLYTAAFFYIDTYISPLILEVTKLPLLYLNLSSLSMVYRPAFLGSSGYF